MFLFSFSLAFAAGVQVIKDVPSTFVYPADGFLPFNIHRGTQTMLSLMVPGCSFADPQGVACALLKNDHDPKSPDNDVVVTCIGVNSEAGEIIYNVGLKDIRRFGSVGHGEKEFFHPTGAAISTGGEVAIADSGNNRIALLQHDGLRLGWVKALGKLGARAGQFNGPLGVAYDSQGHLYVADTGNNRIQVRDDNGRFRVLNIPALEGPSAIAVIDAHEAWTFFTQGPYANRLAVIDRKGQRLQTFDLEGGTLALITADQIPDPPVKLYGCAFDYYGNVIATDFGNACLRKFDKDLHYVVTFGSLGTDDFQFTEPRGIAINHQFGQILVAEKNSVQYFWNGADAVGIEVKPADKGFRIPYLLTERALVSAQILDDASNAVTTLSQKQDLEQGPQEIDWTPGASLQKGTYYLKMEVMATYSSRDRIQKEITLPISYIK
jgi:DNA-binding beta-propeller fold protein YncE